MEGNLAPSAATDRGRAQQPTLFELRDDFASGFATNCGRTVRAAHALYDGLTIHALPRVHVAGQTFWEIAVFEVMLAIVCRRNVFNLLVLNRFEYCSNILTCRSGAASVSGCKHAPIRRVIKPLRKVAYPSYFRLVFNARIRGAKRLPHRFERSLQAKTGSDIHPAIVSGKWLPSRQPGG
jgi:hypothetical protein